MAAALVLATGAAADTPCWEYRAVALEYRHQCLLAGDLARDYLSVIGAPRRLAQPFLVGAFRHVVC